METSRCSLLIVWTLASIELSFSWHDRPKLFAHLTSGDFQSFSGILMDGNMSGSDYFTTILYANVVDDVLVVGARNILYKLDAREFRLTQTLRWSSLETEVERCHVKGKEQIECQNYVKVLHQLEDNPDKYLVCGTNAYKPVCREYVDERGSYVLRNEWSGLGLAPFSHLHNSTSVLVGETLFAGTVADFQGVDPIVFRDPLRTVQYDSTQLNRPNFVGSFESKEFVYFFFREAAVEYTNCGKAVFSRVARVCKKDPGFRQNSRSAWTSFFKARLNCSVPGEFPFYLNEIQGVSRLVSGRYGPTEEGVTSSINQIRDDKDENRWRRKDPEEVLYATFSTPANGIGASAVCAFRLRDIEDAFGGKFKEQHDSSSNWLPVPDHRVPAPRLGMCLNDSMTITDSAQNFIKTHTLMDEAVDALFGAPVVVRTGVASSGFTAVAVDPQVATTDGNAFDVIFVGTTSGRVLKVINAKSMSWKPKGEVDTVLIEELQVFPEGAVIKELKVLNGIRDESRRQFSGRLAVLTDTELRSISVHRCDRATSCQACVALQDPYCAWDARRSRCGAGDWSSKLSSTFIQSVVSGKHAFCPGITDMKGLPSSSNDAAAARASDSFYAYKLLHGVAPPPIGEVVNVYKDDSRSTEPSLDPSLPDDSDGGSHVSVEKASSRDFSLETLIITVAAGAVAALVVGFVTGYCCGRRCQKEDGVGVLPHLPVFQDGDYDYFEQQCGGLSHHPVLGCQQQPHPSGLLGRPLLPAETAKLDNCQEEVTYAEPELVTGGGGESAPLNSRYLGTGLVQQVGPAPQQYTSSLFNGPNKFNTIHSSANKRGGSGVNAPNHYESAADRVVGGSGLKDYTRIGEGGGPLLALRERDFLSQNHHLINSGSANPSYHLSTLGRSSSMRGGNWAAKNPDPASMVHNTTTMTSQGGGGGSIRPSIASTASAGGSSSSSGGGNSSLLNSNEDGSLRLGTGGKRPQVVDSAYGTTRSTRNKVYL